MPPFCPDVKKRKYVKHIPNTMTIKKETSTNNEDTSLWELKKQIWFLQDMIVMNHSKSTST